MKVFNKFLPTRISACKLWLTADRSALILNGSTIAQINDLSGQSNHFTQGTAINQPTLTVAGQNGLNVMTFDNGNDVLDNTSYKPNWNSINFTVFAVTKITDVQVDFNGIITNRDPGGDPNYWVLMRDILGNLTCNIGPVATRINVDTGVDPTTLGTFLVTFIKEGNSSRIYLNKVLKDTKDTTAQNFGDASLVLMIGRLLTATQGWGGEIDEIILYEKAVGDTERGYIENYLTTKWAI